MTRFVVLGDLHYSTAYTNPELERDREIFFDKLFASVRQQEADYVFSIGDAVNDGVPEELAGLRAAAERNGVDMIIVTGNHDIGEIGREAWHQLNGTEVLRRIDTDNLAFLLMETANEDPDEYGGYIWLEQIRWLKEQIKDAYQKGLTIVAMGHHPFYNTTTFSTKEKMFIANSNEVREVLDLVGRPALYCNGHNHTNSLKHDGNWLFVQSAALLVSADYKLIEINDREIKVQTVDIGPDYQEASRLARRLADGLVWHSIPEWKGREADRAITLPL